MIKEMGWTRFNIILTCLNRSRTPQDLLPYRAAGSAPGIPATLIKAISRAKSIIEQSCLLRVSEFLRGLSATLKVVNESNGKTAPSPDRLVSPR